jgi:hypothetical protein
MCDQCEKLLNVPSDKKSIVTLKDRSSVSIDADENKLIMGVDGTPFIAHLLIIKSTERYYGMSIDIAYCPFCGQRLGRD